MNKNYYAIIPADVRYDENITANAKLLYGEITALSNEKGYCWATNEYFAKLYNVSKVSISKWIKSLIENGYINSAMEYGEGNMKTTRRYLTIVSHPPLRKVKDPLKEKLKTPLKEKFKDNNTITNNTINKEYIVQKSNFAQETPFLEEGNKGTPVNECEQIWGQYPNKRGKKRAMSKIKNLINKYSYEQLERCITRYKEYVQHSRKTDFPELKYQNGSTFFTSGFEDYLDENYKEVENNNMQINNNWGGKKF